MIEDQTETPKEVLKSMRRTLRVLTVAVLVLLTLVVGLAAKTYVENNRTTKALCALRTDLEARVENSRDFLNKNPNGIPGIPAETLLVTIEGQERTIRALSSLSC